MSSDNLYNICILAAENNPHSACFMEVAMLLKYSLLSLGYSCDIGINKLASDRTNVLLGSNLLQETLFSFSGDYIIYQLEQLSDNEGWYSESMENLLKNATAVWDYSLQNIDFLKSKGVNAKYLPLGYNRALEIVPHNTNKDITMLFYGSVNKRRQTLRNIMMKRKNAKPHFVYGLYSKERNTLIARSKIVLNIHYYSTNIFEAVRISFLLNNRCFIISEESPVYPYTGVDMCLVPYDKIIDSCFYYLEHPDEMDEIRELTHKQFKNLYSMDRLLEEVLL